jgi:hypothetical protein
MIAIGFVTRGGAAADLFFEVGRRFSTW